MRTTVKHLESAVQEYAKLTGKNYIIRRRDSRIGGYGVCIVYPERGYSQSNDIICGKASEVYNELWAAIRAIEEYQQVQAEKQPVPAPDGPQFILNIAFGMVQRVVKIGEGELKYILIDEDEIIKEGHQSGKTAAFSSPNEYLKNVIITELSELVCTTIGNSEDDTLNAIINALGYNLKN